MSRYIDADEIVYFNDTGEDRPIEAALVAYKGQIDRIPSADVAPVVHGHYKKRYLEESGRYDLECSKCGFRIVLDYYDIQYARYCNSCGAKMESEGEE